MTGMLLAQAPADTKTMVLDGQNITMVSVEQTPDLATLFTTYAVDVNSLGTVRDFVEKILPDSVRTPEVAVTVTQAVFESANRVIVDLAIGGRQGQMFLSTGAAKLQTTIIYSNAPPGEDYFSLGIYCPQAPAPSGLQDYYLVTNYVQCTCDNPRRRGCTEDDCYYIRTCPTGPEPVTGSCAYMAESWKVR